MGKLHKYNDYRIYKERSEELLKYFSSASGVKTTIPNIKGTSHIMIIKLNESLKLKPSMLALYNVLTDMVTAIVDGSVLNHYAEEKQSFWGIIPVKVRVEDLSRKLIRSDRPIRNDLDMLEKKGLIKADRTLHGFYIKVRMFPEHADFIYKNLPEFERLIKDFNRYIKENNLEKAHKILSEIKEKLNFKQPDSTEGF